MFCQKIEVSIFRGVWITSLCLSSDVFFDLWIYSIRNKHVADCCYLGRMVLEERRTTSICKHFNGSMLQRRMFTKCDESFFVFVFRVGRVGINHSHSLDWQIWVDIIFMLLNGISFGFSLSSLTCLMNTTMLFSLEGFLFMLKTENKRNRFNICQAKGVKLLRKASFRNGKSVITASHKHGPVIIILLIGMLCAFHECLPDCVAYDDSTLLRDRTERRTETRLRYGRLVIMTMIDGDFLFLQWNVLRSHNHENHCGAARLDWSSESTDRQLLLTVLKGPRSIKSL